MDPGVVVFVIEGPIDRDGVSRLCARFQDALDHPGSDRIVCDVGAVPGADAATIDALARLQLIARRGGRQIHLGTASTELLGLLELMGLRRVLPAARPQASSRGGSPKSGKSVAVSRKNVIPAMPPPDTSST
jgi:ABC-type transporter Mla MlaB component